MLLGSKYSQGRIERWPVQVEEARSNHGNRIGVVIESEELLFVFDGFVVVEEVAASYPEICPEHVDQHASSDILHVKDHSADRFVESVDDHFNGGKDPELEEIALPQDGPKGNDHSRRPEVSQDQIVQVDLNSFEVPVLNALVANISPEACHENANLDGPAGYEVCEPDSCPAGILQEGHQETKADEYHDMNIHIHRIMVSHLSNSLFFLSQSRICFHSITKFNKEAEKEDDDELGDKHDNFEESVVSGSLHFGFLFCGLFFWLHFIHLDTIKIKFIFICFYSILLSIPNYS